MAQHTLTLWLLPDMLSISASPDCGYIYFFDAGNFCAIVDRISFLSRHIGFLLFFGYSPPSTLFLTGLSAAPPISARISAGKPDAASGRRMLRYFDAGSIQRQLSARQLADALMFIGALSSK